MDWFWSPRYLINHINLLNIKGSFASGANASLVAKNGTKNIFHFLPLNIELHSFQSHAEDFICSKIKVQDLDTLWVSQLVCETMVFVHIKLSKNIKKKNLLLKSVTYFQNLFKGSVCSRTKALNIKTNYSKILWGDLSIFSESHLLQIMK